MTSLVTVTPALGCGQHVWVRILVGVAPHHLLNRIGSIVRPSCPPMSSDFLSDVALLTDQDNTEEDDTPKVTLMTVHAAKGLEFDTVFIIESNEGVIPYKKANWMMR